MIIISILSMTKGRAGKEVGSSITLKKNPTNKKNMENSFDQEVSWSASANTENLQAKFLL
jgi:hypothetical protein